MDHDERYLDGEMEPQVDERTQEDVGEEPNDAVTIHETETSTNEGPSSWLRESPTPEPGAEDVVERAKKARTAIYVGADECVAKDIDSILGKLLALIESLAAQLDEAKEALRPFAEHGAALEGCEPTDQWCEAETLDGAQTHWLAVEHFQSARTVLAKLEAK